MEDNIEDIRQKRKEELMKSSENEDEVREKQKEEMEKKKQSLLKSMLTDGARKRLNTVRMVKPDIAEKAESDALRLAQRRDIEQVSEENIKEILKQYKREDESNYDIKRR